MKKTIGIVVFAFILSTASAWAAATSPAPAAGSATNATGTALPESTTWTWLSGGNTKGIFFSLPNGGDPTIGYTVFCDQTAAVRIGFGLDMHKMQPEGVFGFSIDAAYRMYLKQFSSLRLYIQPGLFIAKAAKTGDFGANMTLAPNFGFGAEYFFAPSFSMGVGTGLALTFSNSFNDIRFATGTTAITGNFYW